VGSAQEILSSDVSTSFPVLEFGFSSPLPSMQSFTVICVTVTHFCVTIQKNFWYTRPGLPRTHCLRRFLVMLQEINPTELRVASAEKAAYYLDAAIASRTRPLNNKPEGELRLIL